MTKTISAWQARRNFGKLIDEVVACNQSIVIESHGRPKVAIVPVAHLDQWESARERFFDEWFDTARSANVAEDELGSLVDDAIQEVRLEQHHSRAS